MKTTNEANELRVWELEITASVNKKDPFKLKYINITIIKGKVKIDV